MSPRALPAGAHQPRALEIGEMSRDFRLRRVEHGHDIADTKLALDEKMKDAQARLVREGPEDPVDVLTLEHIRLSGY